jgi:RNA polymerase sigma-70 factor, ECF subfamily
MVYSGELPESSVLSGASAGRLRLSPTHLSELPPIFMRGQLVKLSLMILQQETEEMAKTSDDQLMEAVVNRQEQALESIYKRYEPLLRTVILGVIRDESEVDDVLHDVLLQVWEQGHRYNPNDKGLRGLLVTLARRRAFDRLRRRAAYRRATENLKTDTENPLTFEIANNSNQVEIHDLGEILKRAIQELPEAQKEVINLAFFKGMSQREIAAKRQISLGTVKTRLHLAQRKLHNYLLPIQNKI